MLILTKQVRSYTDQTLTHTDLQQNVLHLCIRMSHQVVLQYVVCFQKRRLKLLTDSALEYMLVTQKPRGIGQVWWLTAPNALKLCDTHCIICCMSLSTHLKGTLTFVDPLVSAVPCSERKPIKAGCDMRFFFPHHSLLDSYHSCYFEVGVS